MGWDDGLDTDAYVGTSLNDLGNRLHFDGSAKIDNDLSAGYSLRFDVNGANGFVQDANNDNGGEGPVSVLNSYWYIKSERLGKVSLGRQSHATDDVWVDLSGAGSIFAANLVIFDGQNFNLVSNGVRTTATWGDIATCATTGVGIFGDCGGDRTNSVRYDTPTIAGFVASASWGEDDFYDVALRHNGEFGGFKTAFGAGYQANRDNRIGVVNDAELFQVNAAFLHTATGIFGSVHWGRETQDNGPDTQQLYLKAGVRTSLNALGSTVFYGEYGQDDDMFNGFNGGNVFRDAPLDFGVGARNVGFFGALATDSEMTRWGVGVVQEIDAASMAVWLKYKNYSADITLQNGASPDFEDLHIFALGGAVFF